jgi:uncharacterized protein YceH (UPF0502 family)
LQGPGENEERYERLVAAEVARKKKEKNETKSENVVNKGVQPLHPTLMNAE